MMGKLPSLLRQGGASLAETPITSTPAPDCWPPAGAPAVSSAPIAPKQPSRMTRQLSSPWPGDRKFESRSLQQRVRRQSARRAVRALRAVPGARWAATRSGANGSSEAVPTTSDARAARFFLIWASSQVLTAAAARSRSASSRARRRALTITERSSATPPRNECR
jgi:hypothetical protein